METIFKIECEGEVIAIFDRYDEAEKYIDSLIDEQGYDAEDINLVCSVKMQSSKR